MPPAVDDEAGGTDHVQRLIADALRLQPTRRQQGIGAKDQQRTGPAGGFDQQFNPAQAASLRST